MAPLSLLARFSLIYLLLSACSGAGRSAVCMDGVQLVAALANPEVDTALLPTDITLKVADWAGYALPILVHRNFTILGTAARPVTFDLGVVRSKIQMGNGTTLTLRRLVQFRRNVGPNNQAATLALLYPTSPGEQAMVWMDQGAVVTPVCLSPEQSKLAAKSPLGSRPPGLPGTNIFEIPVVLPSGCINSSDAPPLDRCYAFALRSVDVMVYGVADGPNGTFVPSGYLLWVTDHLTLCVSITPADCLENSFSAVCTGSNPSYSRPAVDEGAGTAPIGRHYLHIFGLIIGCSLGGALLATIALIAIRMVAMKARAWSRQLQNQPGVVAPEGAAAVAAWCGLWCTDGCVPTHDKGGGYSGGNALAAAGDSQRPSRSDGRLDTGPETRAVTGDNDAACATSYKRNAGRGVAEPHAQVISPLTPPREGLAMQVHVVLAPAAPAPTRQLPGEAGAVQGTDGDGDVDQATIYGTAHSTDAGSCSGGSGSSSAQVVTLLPRVLGKGAFGRVYEGLYKGERVAVKVILSSGDEGAFGAATGGDDVPALAQPSHRVWPLQYTSASARGSEQGAVLQPEVSAQGHAPPPAPSAAPHPLDTLEGAATDADGQGTASGGDEFATADAEHHAWALASEVEVLGRCDHPNVVRLLAACLSPPRMCLVMEYCDTNLDRMIYGGGSSGGAPNPLIPLPKLLHIAIQVCQGLAYLHPTIMHRDLKPANVLVNGADSDRPIVKLADFGLARIRAMTLPTMNPEAGTPAYTAPECYDVNNSVVTHRSDMYSMGVLLWAMLTGKYPWEGYSVVAVAYQVVLLRARLPLDQLPDSRCPPRLRKLIQQCWDADPRRRPAAAEAAKELMLVEQALALMDCDSARGEGGGDAGNLVDSEPRPADSAPMRAAWATSPDV